MVLKRASTKPHTGVRRHILEMIVRHHSWQAVSVEDGGEIGQRDVPDRRGLEEQEEEAAAGEIIRTRRHH